MNAVKVALVLALVAYVAAKPSAQADKKKVVCYYGSWAVYRPEPGKFSVENIDPFICTHIIYGFVGLGYDNKLKVLDGYNDLEENWGKGAMKRFTNLKQQNPELKTLLAIGGWNEGSETYSKMASSRETRKIFIDSVVEFLPTQNFDGFDLDWEYPTQRGGKPEDKQNFNLLMQELKEAFEPHGYLLTAAVSAGEATIKEAYDVPALARYLDFVNIMSYDFHGAWDFHPYTHHNAPLFEHPEDYANNNSALNMAQAMRVWNELGLPKEKVIMGLATYGRGFTVNDPSNMYIYAPATQGIPAGPFTREAGYWGYNEVCDQLRQGGWQVNRDQYLQAPYATKDRWWIGYDDVDSIKTKAAYALDQNLGGVMFWSFETDDFHGTCSGESFPLIKTAYRVMNGEIVTPAPTEPTHTTPTTTEETTPDPSAPTDTTTTSTTTTTQGPGQPCPENPGNICNGMTGLRPSDCRCFYYCFADGSTVYAGQCPVGTAFDATSGTCAHPEAVPGCDGSKRMVF